MPRQSLEALLLAIFSWAWTATAEFDGLTFGGLLSHPVRPVKFITSEGNNTPVQRASACANRLLRALIGS
jgi:hypothetical protein